MANGFCPYVLQHIAEITKEANPMYKVEPNGFTSMLLSAGSPGAIKNDSYDGHFKTVKYKYRQRATVAQTDTSASCDVTLVNSYNEATVSIANYRQYSFHINDETMAEYCSDASRKQTVGSPATSVMNEVLDQMVTAANSVIKGINQDVLGLLTWGQNTVSGNNAATTVNISKDAQVQSLSGGVTKILSDYKKNGLSNRPQIVGQGIFLNYVLQQFAKSVDAYGMDSKIMTGAFDFWNDQDFDTSIGSNQIGVFEPNSIQLVEYMKFQGFKAGTMGNSTYFVMPLPLYTQNEVIPVKFDVQLRYHECAATLTDAYTGGALSVEKGWQVIISKNFGLFQIPTDAYRAEDDKWGVNGSLRYSITNDCDTCS